MTPKGIVLDANILIRAVLGVKVSGLLIEYAESVHFYAPRSAFAEAEAHLPGILRKRGVSREALDMGLEGIRYLVQEVPSEAVAPLRVETLRRLGHRDPDDWPVAAAALVLGCPIWTEDKDFFGAGIATWTTDLVEIYLDDDSPGPQPTKRTDGRRPGV